VEETAEKIADPVSSLKVVRGGMDGTDPRGMTAIRLN